ncbi:kinesin-like protein KIN-14S [Exaiptasia diaphana]|uniref:Kinesin-like protein n=1 Tax=Exaiptasia diaphana TaxID=2652724 RepID=A0A913XZJ8_EXADI|nr:kinesin-like protein KIN-14S [Exaiptasia diaphana]KXJ23708.1 Kinesin-4 [Exaiptasia diaphana]
MGNGSSSSRPNTVVVRPAETNQTTFLPERNNHVSVSTTNSSLANGGTSGNSRLTPTCPQYQELDESIEMAASPKVSTRQSFEGDDSRQVRTVECTQNGQQSSEPAEEMVFEVYHSFQNGRDYTVLNNEGTRFYLDSWETGEWQPFPEDWLNFGHIETEARTSTNTDAVSTSDIILDNNNRMEDERMSELDHPLKGKLITYMMDAQCFVHCVFEPSSGAWLKLPLSWELHSPSIKPMISSIQQTIPKWRDQNEILSMLRQCSYDVDETIATYLALNLENDSTWRKKHTHSGSFHGDIGRIQREIQSLRQRVEQLEDQLHVKETELYTQEQQQNNLKTKLEMKESVIAQLEIKMSCLQNNLEDAKAQLDEVASSNDCSIISDEVVRTPTPKRRKINSETVYAAKMSLNGLSKSTQQLKDIFVKERENIQLLLQNAISGIMEFRSTAKYEKEQIAELKKLYHQEALHRRMLYNKVQELRGNIRVFCRCRYDPQAKMAVHFPSEFEVKAQTPSGERTFAFDRVFSPTTTQEKVFEDTLPLITSCVDGYNVCIMAYGQTGSGKTYTMMGPDANPGVNVRSVQELLKLCKQRENVEYTLTVSMLEVYNESLRDLLSDSSTSQLNIIMKGKVVVVTDLTEVQVNSEDSITKIMAKGNANRSVGETKMNTNSSRSHLVLILNVKGVDLVSNSISHGTLTLVDLAGSERISKTEATGQRLVEAAAINKSLSALGQVFTALRTNAMHVPYRNSKLTQLLQGALGGDGKACMFVNISPADYNLSETLSTLNFGSGVKQVQLGKPVQNVKKIAKNRSLMA